MAEKYALTAESVDIAAEKIERFCEKLKITKKDVLKYRLSAEEVLNCWMENNGAEYFTMKIGTRLGVPYITLQMSGAEINPFEKRDDESLIVQRITDIMMRAPIFSYHHGVNTVTLEMKRKRMNSVLKLFIYIAAAILAGTVIKYACSPAFASALLEEVFDPLYSAFMRLIGAIATPLIFLSVVWGIYSIGDISTMERIGKKLIYSIIISIVVFTALFLPSFYAFGLTLSKSGAESSAGSLLSLITDIVPSNIVSPFVDGNTMQIIFMAVSLGVAMLFFSKRVNALGEIVAQGNYVVQLIMETISRFIPALVFMIVLRLILSGMLASVLSSWYLVAALMAAFVLEMAGYALLAAARCKVSPVLLLKKCLPLYFMALTTASSAACMNLAFETAEKKLGVDKSFSGFAVPVCNVLLKISTVPLYLFSIFFFAGSAGMQCGISWLFTAALLTMFLTLATPSTTGGSVVVFALLLARMGLPESALAILIPMNTLMDFFFTSTNQYCNQMLILSTAAKLGLADKDVLHS